MIRNTVTAAMISANALGAGVVSAQPGLLWGHQEGTDGREAAIGIESDGNGGVFVAGWTSGELGGPNAGGADAWLARCDAGGTRLWIAQFGSGGSDYANAAAPDGAGGVFVVGSTSGDLGSPNAGDEDAWLARYDGDGKRLWIRQFGTAQDDGAHAPCPDGAGGVFLSGTTKGDLGGPNGGSLDVWLARYDGNGDRVWIIQFGSVGYDYGGGLAPDGSGGVLIGGGTFGDLGGKHAGDSDAWIAHYDGAGARLWLKQFGTASLDEVRAIACDGGGGAFIAGQTAGKLGGEHYGSSDAWLAHIGGDGEREWTMQFGTGGLDKLNALTPDGDGFVLAAGWTSRELGGPSAGSDDAWVARYDRAGARDWIVQFGSSSSDLAWGVASDSAGGCFVSGTTHGDLFGPNSGDYDAFLARFGVTCYPEFTGDGALDLFDFLGYVNAFNAGEPSADCDKNGGLDLFDFLCFVNAFNAGC